MCGRGCTGWQQRPTSHDLTQDEARTELLGATKADLVDILKGRVIAHGGSKGDLAKRLQDSIDTGRPLTDAERLSIPHHNDAHQHKATCPMFQSTPGTSSKFKPKLPRPRVLPPIAMTNRLPQLGSQPRIAGSRRQTRGCNSPPPVEGRAGPSESQLLSKKAFFACFHFQSVLPPSSGGIKCTPDPFLSLSARALSD